jgi:hypothetical protein
MILPSLPSARVQTGPGPLDVTPLPYHRDTLVDRR